MLLDALAVGDVQRDTGNGLRKAIRPSGSRIPPEVRLAAIGRDKLHRHQIERPRPDASGFLREPQALLAQSQRGPKRLSLDDEVIPVKEFHAAWL